MKNFVSYDEIENLCEIMIKDFIKMKKYKNTQCVNIVGFVTEYLGLSIVYEKFADDNSTRVGFISDGKTELWIEKDGEAFPALFPPGTIVIEESLLAVNESGKKRFTIAHEGAHMIMNRHSPNQIKAAYCNELSDKTYSSKDNMQEAFNLNEVYANRIAAALLMPRFLIQKAFRRFGVKKPIVAYEGYILEEKNKILIQNLADSMGVSYSAFFNRLKELKLFDVHPGEEYVHEKLCFGGDN